MNHFFEAMRAAHARREPFALGLICGGHVVQAVAPLAEQLDFAVTAFDDRPALASHQNFPAASLAARLVARRRNYPARNINWRLCIEKFLPTLDA